MAAKPTSPEQNATLKRLIETCLAEGFTPLGAHAAKGAVGAVAEASRRAGMNRKTLHDRVSKGVIKPNWALYVPKAEAASVVPAPEDRREVTVLRDTIQQLKIALKDADRKIVTEELVREEILKLAAHQPAPADWLTKPGSLHGVAGVPVFQWSDWHCGEVVDLGETNGVNEFNFEIAERRIHRLVDSSLDLCFNHMTGAKGYPGAVIILGGDMISGMLHPELEQTDEDEIFPTILWTRDRLIAAIDKVRARFPRLHIACVPGNHGRVFDKKPHMKHYVTRNADWLIYQLLEAHYKDVGAANVAFQTPSSGEALVPIYHMRFMVTHGDDLGVRGGDGIIGAIGPIMRGEIKMRTSSAQIGRDYDMLVIGHWHQRLLLPRVTVNNTLKGYDEYARRSLRAVPTDPSQNLFFVHPKWGITAHWEVMLENRKTYGGEPWVFSKAVA